MAVSPTGRVHYFTEVEELYNTREDPAQGDHWAWLLSNVRSDLLGNQYLPLNARWLTEEFLLKDWTTLPTHPTVSYNYDCDNGHRAFASHFIREDPADRKPWLRDDFLGETESDESGRLTATTPDGLRYSGFFEFTSESPGPYSGANYIHEIAEHDLPDWLRPVSYDPKGTIRYGRYQYLSFVDAEGLEVEVLIQAGSFDYPDGWDDQVIASDSRIEPLDTTLVNDSTITTASTDPMVLVNHERVQERFECGQELVDLLTPIVAALDHS